VRCYAIQNIWGAHPLSLLITLHISHSIFDRHKLHNQSRPTYLKSVQISPSPCQIPAYTAFRTGLLFLYSIRSFTRSNSRRKDVHQVVAFAIIKLLTNNASHPRVSRGFVTGLVRIGAQCYHWPRMVINRFQSLRSRYDTNQ
jgi:hypothetical protein